ncbi:MAG: DNA-binding protein [Sulfurovum sp. FS08-3]|nr:MAG: DNA-binding protein [Sulfurovum sp. FS08-3]
MKDETKLWLEYADENLQSAKVLLNSMLFNPSLQNAQQASEKYLKAYYIEKGIRLQKIHSLSSLVQTLKERKVFVDISEDEIDLMDSIYLVSKYPLGSVLPDFSPDETICYECLDIARRVGESIKELL